MVEYKKQLREKIRESIASFDEEYIRLSNTGIFSVISSLAEFAAAPVVFAFYSVGREVDTHSIIDLSIELGKTVALPIVLGGGKMEYAVLEPGMGFRKGSLNIPEPSLESRRIYPSGRDIVIVPGLCYDKGGYRLGQGGGYYDRFLKSCSAFSVGVCRERLLVNELSREPHDLPVKCLVTESSIIKGKITAG